MVSYQLLIAKMVQTKWEFRWSNLPHPGNYASQWGRTHILFGYFVALLIIKKINLNASNPDNQCGQWTFTPTTHTHACQTEPMQFAEEPLSIAQQRPIIFSSLFFFTSCLSDDLWLSTTEGRSSGVYKAPTSYSHHSVPALGTHRYYPADRFNPGNWNLHNKY